MFDNLTKQQKRILIIISIIVSIGVIYFIYNKTTLNTNNIDENILITNEQIKENTSTQEQKIEQDNLVVVHITGSVKTPGIVKLKEGSRIEDAIEAAGGLTEEADISNVNLAYILEDGIKIRIPSLYDEDMTNQNIFIEGSGENVIEENDKTDGKLNNNSSNKNININKATEIELQSLPGIGASLASRIVEYREQNGKFNDIQDIKNVSGIGDSKYDNIKDLICVK